MIWRDFDFPIDFYSSKICVLNFANGFLITKMDVLVFKWGLISENRTFDFENEVIDV